MFISKTAGRVGYKYFTQTNTLKNILITNRFTSNAIDRKNQNIKLKKNILNNFFPSNFKSHHWINR